MPPFMKLKFTPIFHTMSPISPVHSLSPYFRSVLYMTCDSKAADINTDE